MDNKEIKEKTLNDFILDLKIISKIKPFDKVCVDNDTIRIDNSYIQPIKRFLYNNSRITTIEYLENLDKNLTIEIEKYINENTTISNASNESNISNDSYKSYFNDTSSNILINLSHDITLSLTGLINLKNTYSYDELVISKLEMLISNFELKTKKISNLFIIKS
jgi:recombination DNA repair RAD52 pathway protein